MHITKELDGIIGQELDNHVIQNRYGVVVQCPPDTSFFQAARAGVIDNADLHNSNGNRDKGRTQSFQRNCGL